MCGRIVATTNGPHPAGYLLTTFMPERSTSLHGSLEAAQDVGSFLHANAALADRRGRAGRGRDDAVAARKAITRLAGCWEAHAPGGTNNRRRTLGCGALVAVAQNFVHVSRDCDHDRWRKVRIGDTCY